MKYRTRTYYTEAQKAVMWERWSQGWTLHQIAHLFDRLIPRSGHLVAHGGIGHRDGLVRHRLTLPEREVSAQWPRVAIADRRSPGERHRQCVAAQGMEVQRHRASERGAT
jgi:hypothetical protein